MSLEEAMNANTAATLKLADAMLAKGGGGAGGTPAATSTGKPVGRPKKVTLDQVKAVAKKLMEEKGRPVAVKLINEHGASELAVLDEAKYSSFIAAAEVLLAAEPEPEEPEEAGADL